MTRDELLALPPVLAIKVIYDCLDEETVRAITAKDPIKAPQQPRFDVPLYSSGGVSYASECALSQIDWHVERAKKSAESGGQYAAKDAKLLAKLAEWRKWRGCNPTAIWVGKRGDDESVAAAPPSARPRIYQRAGNGGQRRQQQDDDVDPENF